MVHNLKHKVQNLNRSTQRLGDPVRGKNTSAAPPLSCAEMPKAKKETKAKAKKDPNAPKRGLSAFMCFSVEARPKLKKEQPDLAFGASPPRLLSTLNYN